jgi:hypothetical protein
MLNWLSTAFQSLSSVWRKINPSGDKREADFAKHCKLWETKFSSKRPPEKGRHNHHQHSGMLVMIIAEPEDAVSYCTVDGLWEAKVPSTRPPEKGRRKHHQSCWWFDLIKSYSVSAAISPQLCLIDRLGGQPTRYRHWSAPPHFIPWKEPSVPRGLPFPSKYYLDNSSPNWILCF